jgi:hypothetical protein
MRAKVAVATVQGKAYFLIVNELKQRGVPFISLLPGDPVPVEVRVVVTTPQEKPQINHNQTVTFDAEADPEILGTQIVRILRGKEIYENVVVGVDPGDVFGVAVLADGVVIDTENCYNMKETLNKIKSVLRSIDLSKSAVTIKVGSGVPVFRELLEALDEALPKDVTLEIVGEAATTHHGREGTRRRGLRHIISAARIAGRTGYVYERGQMLEENR